MQNAIDNLGSFMAKLPELLNANTCVNNSLTPEEFERALMAMIAVHNVVDNMNLFGLWDQSKFGY
jgi:hypothetical protein